MGKLHCIYIYIYKTVQIFIGTTKSRYDIKFGEDSHLMVTNINLELKDHKRKKKITSACSPIRLVCRKESKLLRKNKFTELKWNP